MEKSILSKSLYHQKQSTDSVNPYQSTNGIFHRIRTKKFIMYIKTQTIIKSQNNLEEKKKKTELEESGSLTSDYTTKPQ